MKRTPEVLLAHRQKDFVWVERVSAWLDNKFAIGRFRFGLDPILNLVPYGGQIISLSVSMMLVVVMFRNGVRAKVVIKMILNIMMDAVLGAIPFFGQVFDVFNKANEKNIKLLREHYFENKNPGSAARLIVALIGIIILFTQLTVVIMWLVLSWSGSFQIGLLYKGVHINSQNRILVMMSKPRIFAMILIMLILT